MNARHADVVNGVDFISNYFRRDLGFLGDLKIAGARADDGNLSFAGQCDQATHAGFAIGGIFRGRMLVLKALRDVAVNARGQHILCFRQQRSGDGGNVDGRLAPTNIGLL